MILTSSRSKHAFLLSLVICLATTVSACSSSNDTSTDASGQSTAGETTSTGTTDNTDGTNTGDGTGSTTGDTTNTGSADSTQGVACDYMNNSFNDSASVQADSIASWSCSETERELSANGIPDHAVGTFPNDGNPNTISEQQVSATMTLMPTETDVATQMGGPRGTTGYVLNGIKIDASTAGTCDDEGNCTAVGNDGGWNIEALGHASFNFGTDENNAHVQPGGIYHYHGMPEGFITKVGGDDSRMTMIGWAADGFPIYARYGYSIATDATTALKALTGSYQLVSSVASNRPSTELYPLGTFQQDWEYVAGSGDLDECNGRVGVTPEFPGGIYHYYSTDTYPYFQRCVKGEIGSTGGNPPARTAPTDVFDTLHEATSFGNAESIDPSLLF